MKRTPAPTATPRVVRRRRLATTVAIIAVALGVTACQPVYVGPEGPRVAVIGDSVTNHSSEALDASLGKHRRFVSGINGIDLAEGRTKLVKPAVSTNPAVLVIELGINSARESWDSTDLPYLEAVLGDLKAVPCVIWVTPNALGPSYYDHLGSGTINARISLFQASLKKRLPKYPNVHLADFGSIQVQHPEWYDADHLHPNAQGQVEYANYVAGQVAEAC